MKSLLLLSAAVLTGCTTIVPVTQKFPDAPPELMAKCPQLVTLAPTETAITDLLRVVVKNYATYYECSARLEGWHDWHGAQKQIFQEVGKK